MSTPPLDLVYELQIDLGWDANFAADADKEYRRWLHLRAKAFDFEACKLPPSRVVAMVWNLHRQWTQDYVNVCNALGGFIHHYPPAMRVNIAMEQAYTNTLQIYRTEYNVDPPKHYWGPSMCSTEVNNDAREENDEPQQFTSDSPLLLTDEFNTPRRHPEASPRSLRAKKRSSKIESEPTRSAPSTPAAGSVTPNGERSSASAGRPSSGGRSIRHSRVDKSMILRPLGPGERRRRGRPSASDYVPASQVPTPKKRRPGRPRRRPITTPTKPSTDTVEDADSNKKSSPEPPVRSSAQPIAPRPTPLGGTTPYPSDTGSVSVQTANRKPSSVSTPSAATIKVPAQDAAPTSAPDLITASTPALVAASTPAPVAASSAPVAASSADPVAASSAAPVIALTTTPVVASTPASVAASAPSLVATSGSAPVIASSSQLAAASTPIPPIPAPAVASTHVADVPNFPSIATMSPNSQARDGNNNVTVTATTTTDALPSTSAMLASHVRREIPFKRPRGRPRKDGSWPRPRARNPVKPLSVEKLSAAAATDTAAKAAIAGVQAVTPLEATNARGSDRGDLMVSTPSNAQPMTTGGPMLIPTGSQMSTAAPIPPAPPTAPAVSLHRQTPLAGSRMVDSAKSVMLSPPPNVAMRGDIDLTRDMAGTSTVGVSSGVDPASMGDANKETTMPLPV